MNVVVIGSISDDKVFAFTVARRLVRDIKNAADIGSKEDALRRVSSTLNNIDGTGAYLLAARIMCSRVRHVIYLVN